MSRACLFLIGLVWLPCLVRAEGFPPGGSFPLHVEIARVFGFLDPGTFAELVADTGARVAEREGRDPRLFRFFVIDTHEVDAFSLPGGFVYLSRGRLSRVSSTRELEALLGDLIERGTQAEARREQREAEPWARFRGIGWAAEHGPAVLLRDRVERAIANAARTDRTRANDSPDADPELTKLLRSLPSGPNPDHGVADPDGRFVHRALGFSLRTPPGWTVRGGARMVDARSSEGAVALEVVAFPSALELDVLVERSIREVERERRVRVEDESRSSGSHHGFDYAALDYRLVRGRSETPARCMWIRSGRRVYRLLAVSTLEAHWKQPQLLRELARGFHPLPAEADDANAPN